MKFSGKLDEKVIRENGTFRVSIVTTIMRKKKIIIKGAL